MEETLKCLKIGPERSNALWDILLAIEEKAKMLAGSTLTMKSVRLQAEYMMSTRQELPSMEPPWTSVYIGEGLFLPSRA